MFMPIYTSAKSSGFIFICQCCCMKLHECVQFRCVGTKSAITCRFKRCGIRPEVQLLTVDLLPAPQRSRFSAPVPDHWRPAQRSPRMPAEYPHPAPGTGGSGRMLRWKVILLVFNMHFWIAILTVFCRDGNDLQTTREYGAIMNKTDLKNTGRCRKAANHFQSWRKKI